MNNQLFGCGQNFMVLFLTVNAGSGEAQVSCYRCVNDFFHYLMVCIKGFLKTKLSFCVKWPLFVPNFK